MFCFLAILGSKKDFRKCIAEINAYPNNSMAHLYWLLSWNWFLKTRLTSIHHLSCVLFLKTERPKITSSGRGQSNILSCSFYLSEEHTFLIYGLNITWQAKHQSSSKHFFQMAQKFYNSRDTINYIIFDLMSSQGFAQTSTYFVHALMMLTSKVFSPKS